MTAQLDPVGPHAFPASYRNWKRKHSEEASMAGYPQKVEITKTVPVSNHETLEVWLNKELGAWLNDHGDDIGVAGTKAIELIVKAGFAIQQPTVSRW